MILLKEFKKRVPNYSERYKKTLFEAISNTGGGSAETKSYLGKHFENNYELYSYAFWIGITNDRRIEFSPGDKKVNFSHSIENWGRKANSKRQNFDWIQNSIFILCFNRSNLDLLALDKGEITIKSAVDELVRILEEYTYGGLELLTSELNEKDGAIAEGFFADFLLS